MDSYELELFGNFNDLEIQAVKDVRGNFWFTQETVADALGLDRSTVSKLRSRHPGELTEFDEWTTMVVNGRRHVVFSEEGFLVCCDMSTTETAFRLRRWMRRQFRVKHEGNALRVSPKLQRDDLSDLPESLQMIQRMLDEIASNHREIRRIDHEKAALEDRQDELTESVAETKARVEILEQAATVRPGEMSAVQLASRVRWISSSSAPHNVAVILAAVNEKFIERGLMVKRHDEGPAAYSKEVEVWVFTPSGVTEFCTVIDKKYNSGQRFQIKPNAIAKTHGYKHKRNVCKL